MTFRTLPDIQEGLPTTPRHLEGPCIHSWTFARATAHSRTTGRASRLLPDIREGREDLLNTPGHLGGFPDHYRTSGRASRTLPGIREASQTSRRASQLLPDNRKGLPPLRDI